MDQTEVPILHIPVSILCLKSCTQGPLVAVGLSGSNNTRVVAAISRDVDYVLTMNDMWAVMLTLIANLALHRCWSLNSANWRLCLGFGFPWLSAPGYVSVER